MSARRALIGLLALAALAFPAAARADSPAWMLQSLAAPTKFVPGDESGVARYEVFATNSGAAATDGSPVTITDTLPKGLEVKDVELKLTRPPSDDLAPQACETTVAAEVATVSCVIDESLTTGIETPAVFLPGEQARLVVYLGVPDGEAVVPLENQVTIEGGGAALAASQSHNEIDPACEAERECADTGFQEFGAFALDADGQPLGAAAAHPYQLTTSFAVNLNPAPPAAELPFLPAKGDLKLIEVKLPPGLLADPTAVAQCTAQQFNTIHGVIYKGRSIAQNECPDDAAVGVAATEQLEGTGRDGLKPIYNLVPPKGMPAQFGFQPEFGLPVYIDTAVTSAGAEGLVARALVRNVTEAKRITAALVSLWGDPTDPSHDHQRGQCAQEPGETCPSGLEEVAFVRLPTNCENPFAISMSFTTWALPPTGAAATDARPPLGNCAAPPFAPTIESRPTVETADSPTGLRFDLRMPQPADPDALAEADLRDTTVTLPPGLVVNPASADGLGACAPAQIGLTSAPGAAPILFDEAPAACPEASKVGTVSVSTPLLDHPVQGSVYLATQQNNPFNSLIALYIALEDPQTGVVVKLAAEVTPDPATGRLSATVTRNPQVPFEQFSFRFTSGPRAPLRTPAACGTHTTTSRMTPWSSPARADELPADSFQIAAGPGGSPCPNGALLPQLSAGLADPTAGAFSPFRLRLTRADGTQEFAALSTLAPTGLSARLAGIPYCPEGGIAQAAARSAPGTGALELASPSCPAASRVGTVSAGAGAGPAPYFTSGPVYLAGPYKGAPLSLVAIIPAVAGPFDLGVVANRIALHVDPRTAQVSAISDPLPRILFGIPLDVRDIRVALDRPGFTLAPTSCNAKSIAATVLGTQGAAAQLANHFQVGGCERLRFKPRLKLKLKGATRRSSNPGLRAVLTQPPGQANIARTAVILPRSAFIDNAHINNPCTRVQYAAGACPPKSVLGTATAYSPLLDAPLSGKVYFRSNGGERELPDLVAALEGQVDVELVGFIDSVLNKRKDISRVRTTFAVLPDAPVSRFVLNMKGGKVGLIENSLNLCKIKRNRATVKMRAHDGEVLKSRPVVRDDCKKAKKKKSGKKRRAR